jgi:5-methyltetrahydrofolate--homocysteine methyltransferase
MDGVNVMNVWVGDQPEARDTLLKSNKVTLLNQFAKAEKKAAKEDELRATLPDRVISFDKHVLPEMPWFGCERFAYSLRQLAPYLDTKTLFALNWKFGGKASREKRGETPEKLTALFEEWVHRADREGWIQPQGLAACYPCQSDGEEVVLYDLGDRAKEIARFRFDRVIGAGKEDLVCAASYFRPVGSVEYDAIGLQITTSGPQVDGFIDAFRDSGDSESTLFLQGLSDRVAEDMADHVHNAMRDRLGFGKGHGTRWSPGYPAITDTAYNQVIFDLLDAGNGIGVKMTEAGEFSPTGTTAALVSFHPDARYT